ncbi:MAG TPA: UvrD-helicase domain-containing protein [Gaiellaceae bacterium]|nr:UvrD-helicase domain-containing protein [Gaiellaceae bacterium]
MSSEDRVRGRNENSDAIATYGAPRMLAVSGPGTGKSTLFKARLQYWLDRYPEHRLFVATFVRKLVRDLDDDIRNDARIRDEQKACVSVLTLHGLARSVIERSQGTSDLPLGPHCLVITQQWEAMVWNDAVSLAGRSTSDFHWKTYEQHLFDGEPSSEAGLPELRKVHLHLQQFYNALTFTDLIILGVQAVTEHPELVEQTLYIVDEFQDFNLAEKTFIERLTADSDGVFLAGDDDQVLYDSLRRGHPSIIRSYYHDEAWVNAMLPFCGRCDFHICKAAEAFLAADEPPDRIDKVFIPLGSEDGAAKVRVVASTSPSTGVEYVGRFIDEHRAEIEARQQALKEKTEKDSYLLILTPSRQMNFMKPDAADERLRALVKPYAAEAEQLGEEYWRLVDYYNAGVEPFQNYAVRKVLAREGVGQDTVTALLREALDAGLNLADLDDAVLRACIEKCGSVRDAIQSDIAVDEKARELEALGFRDAETLEHDLQRRPIGDWLDADADDAAPEQAQSVGAVEVTTIVGAKGLSADHVIVIGCDEVNLAYTSRSAFFVALTRARKSLALLACMGGGGASRLHEFACSLPEQHVECLQAKAGGALREFSTVAELQEQLGKTAYARKIAAQQRK